MLIGCTRAPPISVGDQSLVAEHRLFDFGVVRGLNACVGGYYAKAGEYYERAEFNLLIDRTGRVRGASVSPDRVLEHAGTQPCVAAVQGVVAGWRYRPFLVRGSAVEANIKERVLIAPPERWRDARRAFPVAIDYRSARVVLRRQAGLAICSSPMLTGYEVEVRGDGRVVFKGTLHTGSWEHPTYVEEERHASLGEGAFAELMQQVRQADFFSMRDEYISGWTDLPGYDITISVGGQEARVRYYVGEAVGAPSQLTQLAKAIDRAAGTRQWVSATCAHVLEPRAPF